MTTYNLILFVYGLAFVALGIAVWFRRYRPARRRSDLGFPWLALFATSQGLLPWLFLFGQTNSLSSWLFWTGAAVAGVSFFALARFALLFLGKDAENRAVADSVASLKKALQERADAERRALENEQRFKDFAESASDWMWEMDENLRFSFVSDLARKLAGRPLDNMIGVTREELLLKDEDREKWRPHLADLKAQRPFRDFRYTYTRPDGIERLWSISGKPIFDPDGRFKGYRGIGRDITEWTLTEQALAKNEERFRALIENALDVITVLDGNGTISFGSPSIEQLLGYTPEEIVGISVFDLIHPEDKKQVLTAMSAAAAQPNSFAAVQLRVRHKDGTWREIEAIGRDLLANEAVRGIVVNSRDITERNQIAEQLRQAQKMDAIGQLTGGVAHDFNNLLAIMQGNLELAKEDLDGNEAALRHIVTALRAAHRGGELTHRLLAFSRKQTLSPVTVNLNERIQDVVDMLQRLLGETVQIVVETEPELWPCDIDPAQLEVSLVNLGINARDAMPDGGTLTIRSANVHRSNSQTKDGHSSGNGAANRAAAAGDYVALSVSDTGVGIDNTVIDKVFDPFFTTKGVGKGTGLGLSMVYGFIKQSGGNVTIDSSPEAGTTVTLLLPRSRQKAHGEAEASRSSVATANGERIMVIEDDDDVRDMAMTQLNALGYRAVTACDGGTALEKIDTFSDIDLVLTDLSLPGGMNGRQVAGQLVERHPHLKVLYMSGYTVGGATPDGEPLTDGALLIQKPFNRTDLARMVRVALDAN